MGAPGWRLRHANGGTMRLVSQIKMPAPGLRYGSQRNPSAHSSATRISTSPFGMVGDQTRRPKRTWLNTEPPRLAMPCTSLCLTSKPCDCASNASTLETMRTPCPPTPTMRTVNAACAGAPMRYSKETPADVVAHVAEAYAIDATDMAEQLGNERAANVVLLGALSTALDFSTTDWERTVAEFVPKKTVAVNLEAFRRGRGWIEQARNTTPPVEAPVTRTPAPADAAYRVRLEINPVWCKSCDICVKMCPEHCLRLNADRIAELAEPERCTGCRLCEWLCPDFAIRVHLDSTGAVAQQGLAR